MKREKKYFLWIIMACSYASLIQSMMSQVKQTRRLQGLKPVVTQPIQPTDTSVPSSLSEPIYEQEVIQPSLLDKKELLRMQTEPHKENSFAQKFHNWIASWFMPQPPESAVIYTEEVTTSPFGPGGQRRTYATHTQKNQIPESFEPSLKSKFPWTDEYKIEALFKEMNNELKEKLIPGGSSVANLKKLIEKSGYNPLNRYVSSEPSFFAKLLVRSFEKSLNNAYFGMTYPYPQNTNEILTFYEMGARWKVGEEWNEAEDGIRGLLRKIMARTHIRQLGNINGKSELKRVLKIASINVEWYTFLNEINLQSSEFNSPYIDWNAMKELSELELDPIKLQQTIDDLQKNPNQLLNSSHRITLVIITKYGRSDRPITGEYVLNLLRRAGFTGVEGAKQQYQGGHQEYQQQRGSQFGGNEEEIERQKKEEQRKQREQQEQAERKKRKEEQEQRWEEEFRTHWEREFRAHSEGTQSKLAVAKNKLTRLLGISATSSEKDISNAYRKFVKQYHPDVTKKPNDPMSLKLKNEINPAWDEYNDALKAINQEKTNRE